MDDKFVIIDPELGKIDLSDDAQVTAVINEIKNMPKPVRKADNGFQKDDGNWVTLEDGRHILIGGDPINGMSRGAVYSAILTAAEANPNVEDAHALASDLTNRYAQAEDEKETIDKAIEDASNKIPGSTVIEPDLKGFQPDGTFDPSRAVDKFNQTGDIKDLARNTLLVNSVDDANTAAGLLQDTPGISMKDDYFANPTNLGFVGMNLTHTGDNGMGEIQVNVPEVLYYKDPESVSQSVMGNDLFSQVQSSAQNAGLVAGEGHELYNQFRTIESTAIAEGRTNTDGSYNWTPQELGTVNQLV